MLLSELLFTNLSIMRNFLILFTFLCSISNIYSQDKSLKKIYHDDGGNKIYHHTEVDVPPKYKGGEKKMYKFIGKNIEYPKQARKKGVSGRVFMSFVIEVDGSISNVKIVHGIEQSCDNEAKRVIESFPKWKPAKIDGIPVRVQYNLPIKFSLD